MARSNESLSTRVSGAVLKTRRVFFKLSMREKVLALFFAFALVFIWFSWQLDRHSLLGDKHDSVRLREQNQKMELDEGPTVRTDYESRMAEIDLPSLPSKEDVSAQVDALVRRSGFSNFELSPARTEQGAGLLFHTFSLGVDKVTYEKIKSFTETIKSDLPFLSLERVVISAQTRDDSFLDVRYVFKSIEYTK